MTAAPGGGGPPGATVVVVVVVVRVVRVIRLRRVVLFGWLLGLVGNWESDGRVGNWFSESPSCPDSAGRRKSCGGAAAGGGQRGTVIDCNSRFNSWKSLSRRMMEPFENSMYRFSSVS